MVRYNCPEHGTREMAAVNWNQRGTTYDDGSFDFVSVFELTCGCQVREELYARGRPIRYRTKEWDDVTLWFRPARQS